MTRRRANSAGPVQDGAGISFGLRPFSPWEFVPVSWTLDLRRDQLRRKRHNGESSPDQTETLTGEVAIQATVPTKTTTPSPSSTIRRPARRELRAHAGEEQRGREEDDAEHVVRRALDVRAAPRRPDRPTPPRAGPPSSCAASWYWGIANGVSGAFGFFSGFVAIQASTAGLNSVSEPVEVEVGERASPRARRRRPRR